MRERNLCLSGTSSSACSKLVGFRLFTRFDRAPRVGAEAGCWHLFGGILTAARSSHRGARLLLHPSFFSLQQRLSKGRKDSCRSPPRPKIARPCPYSIRHMLLGIWTKVKRKRIDDKARQVEGRLERNWSAHPRASRRNATRGACGTPRNQPGTALEVGARKVRTDCRNTGSTC